MGSLFRRSESRSLYYDRQGKLIDLFTWGRLHEDHEYRVIGSDLIGPYRVSTVWLGLDHSFTDGPPVIFETMIFERALTYSEYFHNYYHQSVDFQERYTTEGDAWVGHWAACWLLLSNVLFTTGLPA